MKHFNKFKNQIRQENIDMPEGLRWDDMQEGIFDKMGSEQTITKSSISGNKIFILSLVTLLCTVTVLLIYLHTKNSKTTSTTINVVNKNEERKSDSNNSEIKTTNDMNVSYNSSSKLSSPDSQKLSSKNDLALSPDLEIGTVGKNKINPDSQIDVITGDIIDQHSNDSSKLYLNKKIKRIETASNLDHSLESKSNITDSKTPQNLVTAAATIDEYINHKISESNPNQSNDKTLIAENRNPTFDIGNEAKRSVEEVNGFTTLPIAIAGVSRSKNEHYLKGLELDIDPISRLASKKLWSLELSSGWNTWNYGLSNIDNSNSIFNNTHSEYGFSYSLRLDRKINRTFSITSGVDLDFLYKKLEVSYNKYKDREVKNVLLSYSLNSITGQTSNQVYGDTVVVDTFVNSLTDFNKFQVIQIPLIINYEIISNPSWRLEAGIGPSISLLTNYNGKYLENDELHSYSKTQNIYNTSPKIALNANIKISKNLGRNYYVGVRADFRNHFSSWSNQSGTELKPKIVSGLITLGKSF